MSLTRFIQAIPALVALIPQVLALIEAIQNAFAHKAAVAAGLSMASETQWWLYVPGQAAAGAAVSLALLALLQPRMNAMAAAYRREQAAEAAALQMVLAEREQLHKANILAAQVAALSPACQQVARGQ